MTPARASVVAVSSSEQQRETLAIMLDPDFDVTVIASPAGLEREAPPRAVVLCAGDTSADGDAMRWDDAAVGHVLRRFPGAGLVLVDAPQPLAAQFPAAALASWSDPFSVPSAVAEVSGRGGKSAPRVNAALSDALGAVDLALRPSLETMLSLAALVQVARRPASVEIAAHFLGEQVSSLRDRFAWVDWFDEEIGGGDGADTGGDFVAALRTAIDERRLRALCRRLEFEWNVDDVFPLPCSRERLLVLARCLRAGLLDLAPGRVTIDADHRGLRCHHASLHANTEALPFAFAVSASLLRRAQARFDLAEGRLTLAREDEVDRPHA